MPREIPGCLQGLDADRDSTSDDEELSYRGDELMYAGIRVPFNLHGDFRSKIWRLRKRGGR